VRIHFTRGDLARTHLADGADAMWELVNSLQVLQAGYGRAVFRGWRGQAGRALRLAGLAATVRTRLFPIAPHAAYFPDLLTPPEGVLGVEEALEAILSTPRHRFDAEIGLLRGRGGDGAWLTDLRVARIDAVRAFADAIRAYHHHSVAPYWDDVRACVDGDLAVRRQAMRIGGVNGLLGSYRPMMAWDDPVLELPTHPSDREVHLHGRGLLLIPSYFCHLHPVTIFDPDLPQVVVYPIDHAPSRFQARGVSPDGRSLDRLLGDTRAEVLRAVQTGRTTGELAHRLGVAPGTISHHTGILRDAGLIASHRIANTMLHTLTSLGVALLGEVNALSANTGPGPAISNHARISSNRMRSMADPKG
jgi:DNA-binding transcriptional ArsR family regulator